tara:strand:- start:261 stop:608 length:348 start_codon:yes stop_codon:yes gene_type:complete
MGSPKKYDSDIEELLEGFSEESLVEMVTEVPYEYFINNRDKFPWLKLKEDYKFEEIVTAIIDYDKNIRLAAATLLNLNKSSYITKEKNKISSRITRGKIKKNKIRSRITRSGNSY